MQTPDSADRRLSASRTKKTAPAKRAENSLANRENASLELRDLEKAINAVCEKFSFAREDVEPLKTKLARVTAAWRLSKARHRQEFHAARAKLAALTNGQIERWIAGSGDEELKAFFRRVWRDDVRQGESDDIAPVQVEDASRPARSRELAIQGNAATSEPSAVARPMTEPSR
jgi:hypothetical protein